MAGRRIKIRNFEIGGGKPFFICGPCVVESEDIAFETADHIVKIASEFKVPVVYKSSYKKANRTSINSFSTLGMSEALGIIDKVKSKYNIPALTDVHTAEDVAEASKIVDILQIPAFLCRQTDLIRAAAGTGLPINIKKGQFMAPEDMADAAAKAEVAGNRNIMLTERGTTFGYHDLVVDYRGLIIMRNLGYPVIFDCTHSVQRPGAAGGSSGGSPEFIIPLARAAAAVGIDGLFLETHPEPAEALCDKNCQLKLDLLHGLFKQVLEIW